MTGVCAYEHDPHRSRLVAKSQSRTPERIRSKLTNNIRPILPCDAVELRIFLQLALAWTHAINVCFKSAKDSVLANFRSAQLTFPCSGCVERQTIWSYPHHISIFLMERLDTLGMASFIELPIISGVKSCPRCWPGEFGEWVEVEVVDDSSAKVEKILGVYQFKLSLAC